MNKPNAFKKNFPWGLMTFLAIGVAIAALVPYATFNSDNFNNATSRFAAESPLRYAGLFVHAFSSGLALILGPFQFLTKLRDRRRNLHRWMGRVYLLSVLLGGLSAFLIAPGLVSGLVGEVGLMLLAFLWLSSGFMAYANIRAGNVNAHREWMIRNYALTFAGVMLRLLLGTLIATQMPFLETKYSGDFDSLFVEVYRVVMWLSWVPNLIVAEMIIQRRRMPQPVLSIEQYHTQTQTQDL